MSLDDAEAHLAAQEAQLVDQIAEGNIEEPMRELYRRYAKNLYRFGLHMLGDEGLAEEMVQESFQRLWRSAGRFDARRGSVGAFLFVIARSAAADIRKRPSSRPLLPVHIRPREFLAFGGQLVGGPGRPLRCGQRLT